MNRETFIRSILADPLNDGPRKVFADWLEERGECDEALRIREAVEGKHAPADRWSRKEIALESLVGQTIAAIHNGGDEVVITLVTGERYKMCHDQSCCENVSVEDIVGDLNDLVGSPLTMAEEETSGENPEGVDKGYQDSFTWTFYRFATVKGYVTIRWYGESNGYYSETVDVVRER